MKLSKKIVLFFCAGLISISAHCAPPRFKTDTSVLSIQQRELYSDVGNILNDWSGENEKLVKAGVLIDSFIKSDPDFLPIYIEKARLTIMQGATGSKSDFDKANRAALKILADVQKKDSAYAKSYVLAGHAFLNVGDFDNSRKSLERAERIGTTDPWLYLNWADLLSHQDQADKALAYARKGLALSKDNSKALVNAISFIAKYAGSSGQPASGTDIPLLVFESFKEPDERMRIASRLIAGYGGESSILDYAYVMIDRQSQETPHRESVDLTLAQWFLKKGYRSSPDQIARYDPQFSAIADKILDTIEPSTSANARIFSYKLEIALSNHDLHKANALLGTADAGGVPSGRVMAGRARLAWLQGDHQAAIRILEKLAESDPDFQDEHLLAAAYARLGRPEMLAAHYKKLVDRNPTSAWDLGNYSGFLLFTMHDIDGAIHYGDEALKQMEYPIAQNTTSLAYLMKAAMVKRSGNQAQARNYAGRALTIGFDEDFIYTRCGNYCADIRELLVQP